MSDPNVVDPNAIPEGFPAPPDFNSTYLDDVDVIIEDPATQVSVKPEEIEAMRQKLAEQEKQITDLKTQGDTSRAIQAGITALGQSLRQPGMTPSAQPTVIQQSGETEEVFQKRLDEGLLERGATATMGEYFSRKLLPEVQRLLQNNLVNSRRFVVMDPTRGVLYQKYRQDIEAAVAALSPADKLYDPEVYEKMTDRIAALHANEIIDERVQQQVAAQLEKLKAAQLPTAKPGPVAAVAAARGERPAPAPVRREVRLTAEEAKYAKDHLIPPQEYAAYLTRKGLKK